MLFNSLEFALFLPATFLVYWLLLGRSLRLQNLFVLVASYVFYGWWDWRFLGLIVFSTVVDYSVGLALARAGDDGRRRELLLGVSLATNLGLLGFFKYFNFFAENLAIAAASVGVTLDFVTLNVVLPVGISFYTFQTLSYTIDVYRKRMEPVGDPIVFAAYVAFFPQLVAGPIERASRLIPQFQRPRRFDEGAATDGLRQILWGLFKKVVIADSCAVIVDEVFSNAAAHDGSTLLLAAVLFAFQIYGDFSGYSDIAIGTARLFGFSLMTNFAYPYFSRDIAEFWRRWHISLSTWFRDYLYIPLGGSRGTRASMVRNTFIIFVVSGFWHGANWTFIVWGLLNALYFLPLLLSDRNRRNIEVVAADGLLPSLREVGAIAVTFLLTTFAWIFFRAPSVTAAVEYLSGIATTSLFSAPELFGERLLFVWILSMLVVEYANRRHLHGLAIGRFGPPVRWAAYILFATVVLDHFGTERSFIYFQF